MPHLTCGQFARYLAHIASGEPPGWDGRTGKNKGNGFRFVPGSQVYGKGLCFTRFVGKGGMYRSRFIPV